MEHAQKLYLVPQHQLDSLKHRLPPERLRETVENELDEAMKNILDLQGLDLHEKAKKYASVLQRFLSLVKQGELEKGVLTLSLPTDDPGPVNKEDVLEDVLKQMPSRSRKNVEYLVSTIRKAKGAAGWNDQGELIINGSVIKGSHMFDLLKCVTAPRTAKQRPVGWDAFLKALADMNAPTSSIPSVEVRQIIDGYKRGVVPSSETASATPSTGRRRKRLELVGSPSFFRTSPESAVFKSPKLNAQPWLSF